MRPEKFWTGIIKLGLVLTIMQNFKPVGPRILEISCSEKKFWKNIRRKTKVRSATIAFGWTN